MITQPVVSSLLEFESDEKTESEQADGSPQTISTRLRASIATKGKRRRFSTEPFTETTLFY